MLTEIIKEVIEDQRLSTFPTDYVGRDKLKQLVALAKSEPVLVITGLRRSGKSTLMSFLRRQTEKSDNFINFDDDRLLAFTVEDFQRLFEVFIELFGHQKTFYLDEVQNIEGWERFVRRLHQQGYQVFITGSNATLFIENSERD